MAKPKVNGNKKIQQVVDDQNKNSEATKKTSRFTFKNEGISVKLDNERFVSVVAYSRVDLLVYLERKDDLDDAITRISRHVKYIIDSAKIGSDDIVYGDITTDCPVGKTYLFQSIYIPYTLKTQKLFNSFKRLKGVENEKLNGVATFSFRKKNVMRITVDPMKNKKGVFFKGFISYSRIPAVYVDNKMKIDERFFLKTGTFIADDIGYSKEEIERINRKELTRNKIHLFGPNSTYKDEIDYFIPFTRRISIITYQSNDIVDNGVLKVDRKFFEIGLHFKTTKTPDGKFVERFKDGPVGIFISRFPAETLEISDLRNLTVDKDGKTLLYRSDEAISYDMSTFDDEAAIINEKFIELLEKPAKEEEKAPDTEENRIDVVTENEVETEESTEETETDIPANDSENEEVFNDIGSLADSDEVESDEDEEFVGEIENDPDVEK